MGLKKSKDKTKAKHSKKTIISLSLFLGPGVILALIFFLAPVILTIALSLTDMDYRFNWDFVGFQNFIDIAHDFLIGMVIKNTLVYVGFTLAFFNIGLALLLSLLTTSISERSGTFFRLIWMLPRLTPSVVYGLLWLWIFDSTRFGLLNSVREMLFGNVEPLDFLSQHPMVVIILANGFVGASFGMILFTSAIKSIPRDYLYAASVDGAGWFFKVRKVILPLLKWQILFTTAYQTLSLLTSFEYILIITDGGPVFSTEVWALYTYHNAFENFRFGFGASLSLILVIIGLVASLIYLRIFKFKEMIQEPRIEVDA
ncbi:MAG: sugar ABC transporter permease [Kosmotoga sp.]|uniref:carbohydrate ABC transporter permease n=1 Tax=Kosmotoga sp. TaxID=1955248 RepID=UPI001DF9951D|nr:sugar ABC transporter permease [Kosmotoga sp.]MBO8165796.1 sugar ABC transporter permease [Kosmotoga sp.]